MNLFSFGSKRPENVSRKQWKTLDADANELAQGALRELMRRILNLPADVARDALLAAIERTE